MSKLALTSMGALCLALAACNQTTAKDESKESDAVTTLADRLAIQDMATRYYSHLGSGAQGNFGDFFTEDGVFEVNGAVYKGKAAIVGLYEGMRARRQPVPEGPRGVSQTLLTNPLIVVKGDTATASYIWTAVANGNPVDKPEVTESGREYDLLAKQPDGRWLIRKRVIIADGGAPASMMKTWQVKRDLDITKD